jgi:hypothetical protein
MDLEPGSAPKGCMGNITARCEGTVALQGASVNGEEVDSDLGPGTLARFDSIMATRVRNWWIPCVLEPGALEKRAGNRGPLSIPLPLSKKVRTEIIPKYWLTVCQEQIATSRRRH